MSVTPVDFTWAKAQCTNVRQWFRARPPSTTPGITGAAEGASLEWIDWLGFLRGYYWTILTYVGGARPQSVPQNIPGNNLVPVRHGARQAQSVWSTVLRHRGIKIRRGPWVFSEVQFEMLANESRNREVFEHVKDHIENYVLTELTRRYRTATVGGRPAAEASSMARRNVAEQLAIRRTRPQRYSHHRRDINYDHHLLGAT